MEHTVDFKVGESVFIPRIFSSNNDFQAIVLSVGRKYVTLVHQEFHNTEDEKEMAFKVDKSPIKPMGQKATFVRSTKMKRSTSKSKKKKNATMNESESLKPPIGRIWKKIKSSKSSRSSKLKPHPTKTLPRAGFLLLWLGVKIASYVRYLILIGCTKE